MLARLMLASYTRWCIAVEEPHGNSHSWSFRATVIFTKLQVADRARAIVRARGAGLGQKDG